MDAPQHAQHWIAQALHAHADAIDAEATEVAQIVAPQHGTRVAFDSDFGAGKGHHRSGGFEYLGHLVDGEHARGATTEKNSGGQIAPHQWV